MLAGLLQDLGVLCLAQAESERYLPLLREARDNIDLVARARRTGLQPRRGRRLGGRAMGPAALPGGEHQPQRGLDAAESPFQACVQLSGAVADIWLDDDADAARERALQQVHDRLELDSALRPGPARISEALPDIASLFDAGLNSRRGCAS
jgi:hypothetical protein